MPPLQADQSKKTVIYHNTTNDTVRANSRWWQLDKDKAYQAVFSVCEDILTNLAVRRRMNYFFSAIYNDTGASFMASRNVNLYYNRTALDGNAMLNQNMTLNALQNAIDTACAMIAKNKPKPQFITDGNVDYNTKVKGKKLTKYVEGCFDDMKMYQIMQRVFLDACIYGTGAIKIFEHDGKLKAENLFIEELLISDIEGMHERPMQIHQRKYIPRDVLAAQFPAFQEQINNAPAISGGAATFDTADVIPVIESWHLQSGKKAKDGKHAICIETATLLFEDYTKDYYPILFFRWAPQSLGFWGRGIVHETWKLQRELDILLQTIQNVMRRISGPVIAVESGSNITESHLTSNRPCKIVEYTAIEPKYLLPPMIQSELYSHVQYLEDRIYKICGVSESQATGNKPEEVRSAVAIRETNDLAQGRFELVAQRYEQLFLDIADVIVDMSSDLDDPTVLVADKGSATSINFKDAIVDRQHYRLQLFPVSGLPSTPAGRLDQLMDYAQAGYLSRDQVMDIVDFPDLEDTVSLETASLHLTQQILSNIKEKGDYMPPGPYLDLQTAFRMASLEVDRSQLQKVDEANIDLLRRWASQCQDLMQQAQASLPQAQAQANAGTPSQQGSAQVGSQMVQPPTGQPPSMPTEQGVPAQ